LTTPRRRAREISDERGFALVLALGILVVLSLVGRTLLAHSTSAARTANLSKTDQTAYALAEGGVNVAASVLSANARPDVWSGHPTQASPSSLTYDGGTVLWWATPAGCSPDTCWLLTAQSTVRNPTGSVAPVHRTVSTR
jgi:Tfp pilus assembly protein PilX